MRLAHFLDEKHVMLDLKSQERFACLEEILEQAETDGYLRNKARALEELVEREQLASTGVGGCIAIPHVFTDEARRPLLILGRSREGVSFEAMDNKPVHLVFVALGSRKDKDLFINILYHLARFLKVQENYDALMAAEEVQEALAVIARAKDNLLAEELKRLVQDERYPQPVPQARLL